jgi:transcriptional regulator of acetoin/glycerol metabolism
MTGKPVHAVSNEAMRILWAYSWPGNVRELKSAIEFACIHCTGSVIQATDLPAESHGAGPSATAQDGTNLSEKERLLLALRQARGNRTEAAQLLGISRATLYRRLGTLGINHEDAHST